jgi:hypothetical protein
MPDNTRSFDLGARITGTRTYGPFGSEMRGEMRYGNYIFDFETITRGFKIRKIRGQCTN